MADFLTHVAAARVPGVFLRDRRIQALFLFGTFLPDLVAKGLYWIVRAPLKFDSASHSLVGLLILAYLAGLFMEERIRGRAFAALFLGGLVHVLVDLAKDVLGGGGAYLWYPFSTAGVEFGLINPGDVVLLAPVNLAVLLALWALERRLSRVRQ